MKEKSCIRCGYTPVHLGRYCVDCFMATHEADGQLKKEEVDRLKRKERLNQKKIRRRALVKAMNTEKRPAEIGERIVIVKPHYTECNWGYKIGEIFTVVERFTASIHTTEGLALWDDEYRVVKEKKATEMESK